MGTGGFCEFLPNKSNSWETGFNAEAAEKSGLREGPASVAGPFCGGQRLVSALGALLLSLQVDPCVRNPQERESKALVLF